MDFRASGEGWEVRLPRLGQKGLEKRRINNAGQGFRVPQKMPENPLQTTPIGLKSDSKSNTDRLHCGRGPSKYLFI